MHERYAADRLQPTALPEGGLAAAVVAVAIEIIGIAIIRPSAGGVSD